MCPPGERPSIDDIAKAYGISSNHLVKIVHNLVKLGFVDSFRGRGGGIQLSRPPAEINIGDVIRKTEPNFALVECFNSEANTCPIVGACGLQSVLGRAMQAFFASLDSVSLADITHKKKELVSALRLFG
jgi:Rrf2 family nitric oxide-sensitive transcriptional repressor